MNPSVYKGLHTYVQRVTEKIPNLCFCLQFNEILLIPDVSNTCWSCDLLETSKKFFLNIIYEAVSIRFKPI